VAKCRHSSAVGVARSLISTGHHSDNSCVSSFVSNQSGIAELTLWKGGALDFAMPRSTCWRFASTIILVAVEAMSVVTLLSVAQAPAIAQFFDDRFPFQNRRQRNPYDWFEQGPLERATPRHERAAPQERGPAADYSKAPAPKKAESKAEAEATTRVLVLGDAMADWLGHGLEIAYADSPEIGIVRQHRTNSGLIRSDVRNDPHGENPDWPKAAREIITAQKPKFVLMMIGLNDRKQIRETAVPASRNAKPAPRPADGAALELDTPSGDKPTETPTTAPGDTSTLEYRTDAWSEAYIRRIDDTIASLKTSGVPVFWVGLPPVRGQKSASDIPFLNDLYRSRADKAGIIYVDVWDGFVDEDGRYAQSGPDVEGQTRRLRSADGVYFTPAGARKLAHYVEREIQRWMSVRSLPVAIATPGEPKVEALPRGGQAGPVMRPLAGPVLQLTAGRGDESAELLGGDARQPTTDALVAKVLVRGEAVSAPAGRADDFAWPRRSVAPVGTDPVVTSTDLPMTPMVAEVKGSKTRIAAAAPSDDVAAKTPAKSAPARRITRHAPAYAEAQWMYRPDYYRRSMYQSYGFQPIFGGRW
jgi:hypothetical protein